MVTQFTITCSSWLLYDGTSTGLTYTYKSGFRYATVFSQFYSGTSATCSQVTLPLGDSADSYNLRIQSSVIDDVGEVTTVNIDLQVGQIIQCSLQQRVNI